MDVRDSIKQALSEALKKVGISDSPEVVILRTTLLKNGDYYTTIANKIIGDYEPNELAGKIKEAIGSIKGVIDIHVPPDTGFINFWLDSSAIAESLRSAIETDMWGANVELADKEIMVEYSQPNPFKEFHVGHLMGTTIGESISRVLEFSGAKVIRVNYQGDVGVHVACAIWGIKKLSIDPTTADEFGTAYVTGATAYKNDENAKREIDDINEKLYERSDPELNKIYDVGREKSLEAFERIYAILGTKFEHYFFESETGPIGKEIVLTHPDIFPESDGARVFKGEEFGLHTRVFISAKGIPTYEAKELGLEKLKKDLYPDVSLFIVETANEINEYFRVVKKALELVYPEIASNLLHISHGLMKLPLGKMSSRTGTIITGESLLADLKNAARERATESRAEDHEKLAQDVAVSAIKYQILKQASGKDIIFDRDRALSLEGDSGPYLQYAHARTRAILEKAKEQNIAAEVDPNADSTDLARLLHRFPEIVKRATKKYEPHLVTTYLLEIAGEFNSWYAQEQILDGTPAAAHKVALTAAVARTLKNGLWILGIPAPEKM